MLVPLTPQPPERIEWEETVARHFCHHFEVANGDAQAMLETHPQALDKAFAMRLSPEDVAAIWQSITCFRDPAIKGPVIVLETHKISGAAPDLPLFAAAPVQALLEVARQLEASASEARNMATQFGGDVTVERVAPFQPWAHEATVAEVVVWTGAGIVLKCWLADGRSDADIATKAVPTPVLECMAAIDQQLALYWGQESEADRVLSAFGQHVEQHSIGSPSKEAAPSNALLCTLSAKVSLSELASPYEREEFGPEWQWLHENAELVAPGMPYADRWMVLLDLSREQVGVPLLLRDIFDQARRQRLRYLLISEN